MTAAMTLITLPSDVDTIQIVSLDNLTIIWHNSYQNIYLFEKREEKDKVALAVELSICFRAEPDTIVFTYISQCYHIKVGFQDSNYKWCVSFMK